MKQQHIRTLLFILFFMTSVHLSAMHTQAACLAPATLNGTQTISVSCSVAADTEELADTCTLSEASTNTGIISLTTATTTLMTVLSGTTGTTVVTANSINLAANTSISISCTNCNIGVVGKQVFVNDADVDGYATIAQSAWPTYNAANTGTFRSATAAGYRRRCLMRETAVDCNDAAFSTTNTCYPAFYPAFYPTFYPAFYPAFDPYGSFSPYGTFYPQFSP